MLRLARNRLGEDAVLLHGDLTEPLPFADAAFDDVVASLVLHYLEDWSAPLAELRRVLIPGGRLIVSVDHPFQSWRQAGPDPDYFAVRRWSFHWTLAGQRALMSSWHRPLHAMTDAFAAAGFRIQVISEPAPLPEAAALFPDQIAGLTKMPNFLFFVLKA